MITVHLKIFMEARQDYREPIQCYKNYFHVKIIIDIYFTWLIILPPDKMFFFTLLITIITPWLICIFLLIVIPTL